MKERPILFNGPMVRAILEGRKTQTRRIAKEPKVIKVVDSKWVSDGISWGPSPYGQVGDRLWVRETWATLNDREVVYRASSEKNILNVPSVKWKPSIHMPRWASRITLEITNVRVERLQDISEEDAKAEGAEQMHIDDLGQTWKTHRRGFEKLWTEIYGDSEEVRLDDRARFSTWDANPWVWVYEFRRLT